MADAALFIGWNRTVAGKEAQAAAFFKESLTLFGAFQKEGHIESFEPVLLAAHGGDMNGYMLLKGAQAKLDALRHDERFTDMVLKGTLWVSGYGVVPAYIGAGLEKLMARWTMLATK
jgi:hypothetical protein